MNLCQEMMALSHIYYNNINKIRKEFHNFNIFYPHMWIKELIFGFFSRNKGWTIKHISCFFAEHIDPQSMASLFCEPGNVQKR